MTDFAHFVAYSNRRFELTLQCLDTRQYDTFRGNTYYYIYAQGEQNKMHMGNRQKPIDGLSPSKRPSTAR